MYEGRIVAEAATPVPLDVREALDVQRDGNALIGMLLMLVAVPVLVVRIFAHLVVRDLRKFATLGRIVHAAIRDAR